MTFQRALALTSLCVALISCSSRAPGSRTRTVQRPVQPVRYSAVTVEPGKSQVSEDPAVFSEELPKMLPITASDAVPNYGEYSTDSRSIGAILPLTGKFASVGEKTLRGLQMGLGLYGENPSSFRLSIIDSEGNSDVARKGVEKLVKEDQTIAIVGSVLSKTASAVASQANSMGVPTLALSQKAGITELGPSIFRNSLTSEQQVQFLVKTAMEDLGMKRFAIVFPNDAYGVEFANLFWDEVLARGGSITAAQTYSQKETDFRDVIQRLVGTYYIDSRIEEYRLRMKDQKLNAQKKSIRNESEELLPPRVDFDGIFIPDSAKSLGQIAAMLSFNDVRGVKLLGTNVWNVPDLAKRAGLFADDVLFVDGFIGADERFQNSQFTRDYKSIYGEEPGMFELQGYDAGLILRQLITQGSTSRQSLVEALSEMKNLAGSLGSLSASADREILRPMVALTLSKSGSLAPLEKK